MKKLSIFFAVISLTIFFIFSCKKEKDDVATVDYGSNNSLRTTVTGMVRDESNAPLTGVTVTAYGQTTSTNQYGTFVLKNLNVNKNRCVLQFVKTGFFNRAHGFIAAGNTVNYVRIILLSNAATQNFSSSVGGTISLPDGSSAQFQPNSFVTTNGSAYTGTINLIVKHLSPDDVNFGFTIPGGDLLGKDLNNKAVVLYTYGMVGVELTGSSGEALQLANGTSATLTLSIVASQLATAPATIPLWFFDETTSLWKEEGTATKVGNNYVGTVAHFSWWNCDYPGERATLKGKVIDCDGNGVPNVIVTVNAYHTLTTNQNGEYQNWVPAGMPLTAQVLASNNVGIFLYSQLENILALSNNQTFIVPDLVFPCITRVTGVIKTCTGEGSDGFVTISNSSFYNFQFTTSGLFNLPVPENTQVDLFATNSSNSYSQNITTLAAPDNLNVGSLLLCDSTNFSINSFTVNGGTFINKHFNIIATDDQATINYSQFFTQVEVAGDAAPNYHFDRYEINIQDTVSGSYPFASNNFGVNILIIFIDPSVSGTNPYYLTSDTIGGTINITQYDHFSGGKIKGTFSGNCIIESPVAGPVNGTFSGNFEGVRN
jgi:hypothetical protein